MYVLYFIHLSLSLSTVYTHRLTRMHTAIPLHQRIHYVIKYHVLQKFATLRAVNISSFEAIRAEIDRNIEGDKYLDYSDEALER